ncbi:hypothetical protein BJX63DRAFT_430298 [Aspergillus granulosus]|uniref:Uncharacterized protein n=1 Tax=Aspergillus granulosus TaxID=176169 RepID=A0ABR4HLE1_9EURO
MSILTPQDSFDTVPDEFISMATTEASIAHNDTQKQCACAQPPAPITTVTTTPAPDDYFQEDDDPIIPRVRGRTRRIPFRRHRRDFSPASSIRSPSLTRFPELEVVSSHTELFTPASATNPTPPLDRLVLLTPFTRPAYITTHPASHYDFAHWLPLLALGAPETWYTFSSNESAIPTSLKLPLLAPPNTYLKSLSDPRPAGLRIPRISANDPLHPAHSAASLPRIKTEAGTLPPPDLIYLSVQSSITGHSTNRSGRWVSPERGGLPDLAGTGTTGSSIYRVVRCGSREEAAAQAFYSAGGNRWSTLFTCVVVGGKRVLSGRVLVLDGEGYERVSSLSELVEGEGSGGEERKGKKIRIFY